MAATHDHEIPQTWHYGLIAKWWSEFSHDGPEIAYFRTFIENGGGPALDVGCGTGRLLLPYLRDGLDVDGCDLSPDMIALCAEQAAREGLSPTLFVQAMHELDLPRTYRTIIVCGAFGLGGTRDQDQEALRRFYSHLEPGGTLVLDNEVPYSDSDMWKYWPKDARATLPATPDAQADRQRGSDGAEYSLRIRVISMDPLDQLITLEIHAEMWRDGELVSEEDRMLTGRSYFRDELLLMLERAGFDQVTVHGGYADEEPTADHDFLTFVAKK